MKAFVIFEDDLYNNFYPLSLTRPLWDIKIGAFSFRERWERFLYSLYGDDVRIFFFTREHIARHSRVLHPDIEVNNFKVFYKSDEFYFLNATSYPLGEHLTLDSDSTLFYRDQPVAARIPSHRLKRGSDSILSMLRNSGAAELELDEKSVSQGIRKISFIWEAIQLNQEIIGYDFRNFFSNKERAASDCVTIIGEKSPISIGENVLFEPFVLLDTRGGPIIIDEGSVINSFSRIEGPAYIGRRCQILGARIRKGCSIGNDCRIGGEVEESIFHGYSNKYHEGFIGHSYIGEWVNMGALTTNSDLKNDYKDVKVYLPDIRKNTKLNKVGCFIGDHVKTSIGTLINTGSSIGPGAMLVHAGQLTPSHIPPFAWFINGKLECKPWFDDFIATAKSVMSRRDVTITDSYIILLKELYEQFGKYEKGR